MVSNLGFSILENKYVKIKEVFFRFSLQNFSKMVTHCYTHYWPSITHPARIYKHHWSLPKPSLDIPLHLALLKQPTNVKNQGETH